jgi:hypothetical protein
VLGGASEPPPPKPTAPKKASEEQTAPADEPKKAELGIEGQQPSETAVN